MQERASLQYAHFFVRGGLQICVIRARDEVHSKAQECLWGVGKSWLEAWQQWVCVGEGGDEGRSKLSIKARAPLLLLPKI